MNNDKSYAGKHAPSLNRAMKSMLSVVAMAFVAVLVACSSDNDGGSPSDPGEMKDITIAVSARAYAADGSIEKESVINTLRIYVFNDAGRLVGYHYTGSLGQDATNISMRLPATSVRIYTIANEGVAGQLKKNNGDEYALPGPVDGSQPSLSQIAITEDDINSLTFDKLPEAELTSGNVDEKDENKKTYDAPLLPMASMRAINLRYTSTVRLSLTRSVAKLNLYFAKQGMLTDTIYMGRGLYLYNVPEYGYLLPRDTYTGGFKNVESDTGDNSDSYLNQKGGKVILQCGWPEEGKPGADMSEENIMKSHINEILRYNNTPENDGDLNTYHRIPARSIYLFANPNAIPESESPSAQKFASTNPGYYIKITAHMHRNNSDGSTDHPGEVYWVALPEVKANDNIEVMSILTVDGYMSITPHWLITEWTPAGGDVEFN